MFTSIDKGGDNPGKDTLGNFASRQCELTFFSSLEKNNARKHNEQPHQSKTNINFLHLRLINRCEVDIILLNDTWIKRVEVHHQDITVPQTLSRIKDKTTFILVLLKTFPFRSVFLRLGILFDGLGLGYVLLPP